MSTFSPESLTAILNKVGVGILILDKKENIIFSNQWFLKYSFKTEEELLNHSIFKTFPELKNTRIEKSIQHCIRNRQHFILSHTLNKVFFPLFENLALKSQNHPMEQFLQLIPIPPDLCMVQITDVSQQVQREKLLKSQMEAAQKSQTEAMAASLAKSDFLASMSHEIRTPLNSVLGMADLLQETELNAEQVSFLNVLKSSGKALYNIINDILDFSRIEAGKFDLDPHSLEFETFLEETISIFQLKAKEKGIHLTMEKGPNLPKNVFLDAGRLQQIFINLIGNAIKFTNKGKILWKISFHPESSGMENLRFEVMDTGIGIPAKKIESIFESFSQVDSSTTRKFGGTGLGLSITKSLVELMQGKIWAESEIGKGSSFFVEIPLASVPLIDPNLPSQKPTLPEASDFPPLRILIAEDSPENVFLLRSFFRKYPFQLQIVNNGNEAVEWFQAHANEIDVILMDMQMPEMDGYQSTTLIRQAEASGIRKGTLPILALSANVLKEDIERAFASGCTSYLTKPVRKQDLLELLYFYSQS